MSIEELKDKIFDKAWEENQGEYLIKLEDLFEILDDYETLSQEWIKENKEVFSAMDYDFTYTMDYDFTYIDTKDLQNLLVPKQEKPVVPEFVAEYIKKVKGLGLTLSEALYVRAEGSIEDDVYIYLYKETYEVVLERELKFSIAYVHGYEIEEESKYYVLFNNHHDDNWTYALTKHGEIEWFEKDELHEFPDTQLTEQEIKDYDDRYWAFAVQVEEGAN